MKASEGLPGGEVGAGQGERFQGEGTECAGMGGKRDRGVFKHAGLVLHYEISNFLLLSFL